MAFIRTVPTDEATGTVREIYDANLRQNGYVSNTSMAFSLRPQVYLAIANVGRELKKSMPARRFELATLVAASRLRCTYCTLAHGELLRAELLSADQVEAVVHDYRTAGLPPAEVALCAFAEKVALNAYKVTEADIEDLRIHGFSDEEILEIAIAVGYRSMISKTLDAMGAVPDEEYLWLEPAYVRALTVGRHVPASAPTGPQG
jgi:uncharacterized peroxidase-related enzyme